MCDTWGGVIRIAVFLALICAIFYFAVLHPVCKVDLTRNFNHCQTVIVCIDRVCDTVDGIFAPKEAAQAVDEAIAKADK
jgi:hypothetical protein